MQVLSSVYRKFLLTLVLFSCIQIHASDSLKVRKTKFFIEPKAALSIPKQFYGTDNSYCNCDDAYWNRNFSVHNLTTVNYGISGGVSFELSKYFRYELSLSYFHYKIHSTETGTDTSAGLPGNMYVFNGVENHITAFNYVGIGNGISFTYKNFIFTNSIFLYANISSRYTVTSHNNIDNSNNTNINYSYGIGAVDYTSRVFESLTAMSEHKIGYSFLNNRIEPYIGINFMLPLAADVPPPVYRWKPFASVKINF